MAPLTGGGPTGAGAACTALQAAAFCTTGLRGATGAGVGVGTDVTGVGSTGAGVGSTGTGVGSTGAVAVSKER